MSTLRFAIARLALCAVCVGCSAGPTNSESIASSQEQAVAFNLNTWTPWPMPLGVCFHRASSDPNDVTYLSSTDYQTMQTWAFNALVETWGSVPSIGFVQDCQSGTRLHITLSGNGNGGSCGWGLGASCWVDGSVADPVSLEKVVVHEVGHGLGLLHEHQRVDTPGLCPVEQSILDGCSRCKVADDAGDPCAAADYNACLLRNVSTPVQLTPADRGDVIARINDRTPVGDGSLLTVYDPLSIMSYCSEYDGRPPDDYRATLLDLLGMEMLYPSASGYPVRCSQGCFNTGNGVIVRTDGAITNDWMDRGAVWVPMWVSGSPVGATVSASYLASGTSSLTYTFWDPRSAAHTGGGTTVKSNATHAAIAGAITAALL